MKDLNNYTDTEIEDAVAALTLLIETSRNQALIKRLQAKVEELSAELWDRQAEDEQVWNALHSESGIQC